MKLKQLLKRNNALYDIFRNVSRLMKKRCMHFINVVCGVQKNKVVFCSYGGKSYSDNPRAVSEKLHELKPDAQIVWLFNEPEKKKKIVPEYVSCVKNNSFKAMIELTTAKIWIDNERKSTSMYKNKNQFYIQTWHGDRGFKKIAYDSPNWTTKSKYIESEICNLMSVGSDYGKKKLSSAFKYSGEFFSYGCPRNDVLLTHDNEMINAIKRGIGIPENYKVLLYAPTYRKGGKKHETEDINFSHIKEKLEECGSDNWVCLTRAHLLSTGLEIQSADASVMNVTDYEDMSDLLLITDILITDYSSSAGDFILTKKLLILYQPDRDLYLSEDRTFYFDIEKSPYIVAKSQEDIINIISTASRKSAEHNCEDIMAFYGTFESGQASLKMAELILDKFK